MTAANLTNNNLMWINGPAGAGKTVILCGKMIQLSEMIIQSDTENKVVVFKFTGEGNNSRDYQDVLDKAGIQYERISTSRREHTPAQLGDRIKESVRRVIIVEVFDLPNTTEFTNRLSELSGYHLFVDDIQRIFYNPDTKKIYTDLINELLKLSDHKKVWIACDIAQMWYIDDMRTNSLNLNKVLTDKLDTSQRRILTKNLRNTCDLSYILSVLRGRVVELCSPGNLDVVLPTQSQGHFIHGPLTVIHVFNDCNVDSIVGVFDTELDRLCAEFKYSDIGVVCATVGSRDVVSLVKDSVDMRCNNTDVKIAVCYSENSYSAEWPAVVVLFEAWDDEAWETSYLSVLYLALSRARVHCTVIIYQEEVETLNTHLYTLTLLERLSNYAHIIWH